MPTPTGQLVTMGGVETLTDKTLTTPTIADLTNVQHLHTDVASGGVIAGGSGAVTRAGGNTTEATTTSTSAVDLLAAAGLSIATDVPILVAVAGRKSAFASNASLGLKLNTTVVGEAVAGTTVLLQMDNNGAAVATRHAIAWIGPRIADYNLQNSGFGLASGAGDTAVAVGSGPTKTAAQPIATITDLVIRGIVGNASLTLGADELHIFAFATS